MGERGVGLGVAGRLLRVQGVLGAVLGLCFGVGVLGGVPAAAQAPVANQPPADSAWTRYPQASKVRIRDSAAIVFVAPQQRRDVAAVVINRGPLPTPTVTARGDRLDIDGGMRRRIGECHGDGGATVGGFGRLRADQLPVIYVRTPADVDLGVGGAVSVYSAPAIGMRIAVGGCSKAFLGPTVEALEASVAGSGAITAGPAAAADVSIAGSGSAHVGSVSGALDVSIAGSGDVSVVAVDGPVRVAIQGSGDVTIGSGAASSLRVAIAGSGDMRFGGVVGDLSAAVAGSGIVRVASVSGNVESRVAGSGSVQTDYRAAPPVPPVAPVPPVPPAAPAVPAAVGRPG